MRLAVLKERRASETRVAATPDTVKRLIGLGLTVAVEAGAGAHAALPDQEFAAAGAVIAAQSHGFVFLWCQAKGFRLGGLRHKTVARQYWLFTPT